MNPWVDWFWRLVTYIAIWWIEALIVLLPVSGCTSAAFLLFGG